jgi:predicted permease
MKHALLRLAARLRDFFFPESRDRDIQQELEFHLNALVEEHLRAGLSPADAQLAARRKFGNALRIKDRGHDVRRAGWIEPILQDTRHAIRRLLRAPAFTAAAVLTLGLAIGANVAIFTVVYRVVWNPLPYPSPDRLIALDYGMPMRNINSGMTSMTWQLYWQLLDRAHTLKSLAVVDTGTVTLTGDGIPERVRITHATPSLTNVLGIPPEIGRWFSEEEGVPRTSPVVVLSHGLWMRRHGGDRGVLGKTVIIDDVPASVIGVMPNGFDSRTDLWMRAQSTRGDASFIFRVTGFARLADGARLEQARTEMTSLIKDLSKTSPNQTGIVSVAIPLKEMLVGNIAPALWMLLAAVGMVLLLACANVTNLFLVRYEARQREIAVRQALGSGRTGIVRYFVAESAVLSVAGGILGLVLAWIAIQLLLAYSPANLPRLGEVRLDQHAVAFTVALSLLTAAIFGTIPILHLGSVAGSLREYGRANTTGRRRYRTRHLLMAGQVALALMLLVGAGLMIRSLQKLRALDPGFDATSALTFSIGLPDRGYPTRQTAVTAHKAILERLSAVPGVTAVSASTCLPLAGGCFGNSLQVEGELQDARSIFRGFVPFRAVAPDYFRATGIRIVRGRGIERSDVEGEESDIVVNQAFANTYFPKQDPIGRRVKSSTPPGSTLPMPTWLTIIGVAANTPTFELAEATPSPQLYMPMSIAGGPDIPIEALIGPSVSTMSYVLRSSIPPSQLAAAARRAVDEIDRNLALAQVRTAQEILDRASDQMAFTMTLMTIAAAVALILGVIGIYGIVSYIVSQRTSETH